MAIYYNATTGCFYNTADDAPPEAGCVAVSQTDYDLLFLAQRKGCRIMADATGNPQAVSEFGAGAAVDLSTVTQSSDFAPQPTLAMAAATALVTARSYVSNSYTMLNEATPDVWVAYLKALMAIANGTDTTSTALPAQPSDMMAASTVATVGA